MPSQSPPLWPCSPPLPGDPLLEIRTAAGPGIQSCGSFLHDGLKACGWPRVAKPGRPNITALIGASNSGAGGGGGGGGSGGACEPGYSPCVPPYPPDLDCSDLNGPINVTRSDPHGLDADNDGVACES